MAFLSGKKIEILLYTPILMQNTDGEGSDRVREETVFRIIGRVETVTETGVYLEVLEMFGNKNVKVLAPHSHLFIPIHKIDHFFAMG